MASQDWIEKDFYAILGVAKDADEATIKKTYRKLARKLHPDQNANDPKAEARFKEIGEAYAVLSDPEQRKQYDQIRAMTHGGARFTAGPGGGGAGGFEDLFSGLFGQGGGGNVRFTTRGGPGGAGGDLDLEEILRMFGQGGGGGGFPGGYAGDPYGGAGGFGGPRGARRGQDVEARTTIGFRQAVTGDTITLSTPTGGQITTRLPAGVKDGQRIKLRGKGQPGGPGGEPGDLILHVAVRPHPVFGREGDHLTVDVPVTFAEAALGATVAVPTLDGGSVKVKVAPGTPSGRVLRIKGRGVHTTKATGDLLATVQVVVPQRLTDEAKAAVETLAAADAGHDPRAELFERARG
ncbi:MAG TPA: DnaJ C-terminal domain-containing protein [Dermatophilaceae bacterium]|mgnify:CR=1 FL=1|nr:DnaJ C-terminal domain-containing protein [Dermatophilaceae bacterium]